MSFHDLGFFVGDLLGTIVMLWFPLQTA